MRGSTLGRSAGRKNNERERERERESIHSHAPGPGVPGPSNFFRDAEVFCIKFGGANTQLG